MDNGVVAEGKPPGAEESAGNRVALFERPRFVFEQLPPVEPGHCEQPFRRKLRQKLRHADRLVALEHQAVKRHVTRFEAVIQLLA